MRNGNRPLPRNAVAQDGTFLIRCSPKRGMGNGTRHSTSQCFFLSLVGHVEERLWWPIQSPNIGRKKKEECCYHYCKLILRQVNRLLDSALVLESKPSHCKSSLGLSDVSGYSSVARELNANAPTCLSESFPLSCSKEDGITPGCAVLTSIQDQHAQ